jgi:endoglucanase
MNFRRGMLVAGLAASSFGCGSEPKTAGPPFVHVEGDQLVDPSGAPLALEGIVIDGRDGPEAYAEVARMGFNHVRFYFDASDLEVDSAPESYSPEALARLDDNVAWARKNGLYLILVLNVPPGGAALNCGSDAFWDSPKYQDRFVDLWRMLAARYAEEPTIAGYALLDVPDPSRSIEQWQQLADRTDQAIRAVDRGHTIYIGHARSVNCIYNLHASDTFVRVADANVVYEFDGLQPWDYVAQLTAPPYDRHQSMLAEYGPYPDETRFVIDQAKATWLYSPEDTRPSSKALKLEPDETEWTKKTFYYKVTDPQFVYAVPALQADKTSGKAYFDDILIEEMTDTDPSVVEDIDVESRDGWYFWEGNDAGVELPGTGLVSVEKTAHRGQASVAISGTTSNANLAINTRVFLVNLGNTYRVTSWVKGENIAPGGSARVRLDFWGYSEPLHGFDRRTLEELFTDFRAWGRSQGVPMAVSVFGTGRPTFENGRGGVAWMSDMIDIMREQQLGWNYWGYRDKDFGIYTNRTGVPDPETMNQPLVDLFTEKLH